MQSPLKMSALKDRYAGRPAAVLGGGPSLPADMARLPKGCLLIAVNHHAFQLCRPHFMVYNDQPGVDVTSQGLREEVIAHRAVLVSPEPTSDIEFDVDVWTGFYSSNTATWFALWLGCDPVLLCGMDLYQGEQKYFHEYNHDVPCFHYSLEHHLRPWQEEGRFRLPPVGRVRAMSGPLGNVFSYFDDSLDK